VEITLEILVAKRDECQQAILRLRGDLDANTGAIQILEELIAIRKAQDPPRDPPKK
jgi:hypothetical protein